MSLADCGSTSIAAARRDPPPRGDGQRLAQVREAEGLVIMEAGMVAYKIAGYDFVRGAQQIAAVLEELR